MLNRPTFSLTIVYWYVFFSGKSHAATMLTLDVSLGHHFCTMRRLSCTGANDVHAPACSQGDSLYADETVHPDYYSDSLSHSRPIWYLHEVPHDSYWQCLCSEMAVSWLNPDWLHVWATRSATSEAWNAPVYYPNEIVEYFRLRCNAITSLCASVAQCVSVLKKLDVSEERRVLKCCARCS